MTDDIRIIGDFMEINADLVAELYRSKAPKFIKKWKMKRVHKRLYSDIEKLRNSGYILNAYNLIEYFSFMYSRFYKEPHQSIEKCIINTDESLYEAMIQFDGIDAIISIDKDVLPKFEIRVRNSSRSFSTQITRLYSENDKKNDILKIINDRLLNDICDYILELLKPYTEEEKDETNRVDQISIQ